MDEDALEVGAAAIRAARRQLGANGGRQTALKKARGLTGKALEKSLLTKGGGTAETGEDSLIAQAAGLLEGQYHAGENEAAQIELAS